MLNVLRSRRAWFALLLTGVALGCSGDGGTGPGAEPVATVEISGMPDELYINATVQLSAMTKDASGGQLANRPVSWISSDTSVATVTAQGLVRGRAPGDAVIVATSEQKSATSTVRVRVEAVASVRLTGAPTAPVMAGTGFQLQATPLNSQGSAITGRSIFWVSGNQNLATVNAQGYVNAIRGGQVQIAAVSDDKSAVFTLTILDPVHTVAVNPSSGALYPTQTLDLSATARSQFNDVITGRPVAWSTSDASKATVDASGKVTAVATGDVSITATVEGKTASATLKVLTRPVASWSGAADWTTYQGNGRHTGFVPVTADPVAFRELWVRAPIGGDALNPVTEGGGRVFVSNVAYFGNQKLAGLDARTGAQAWTHSFGDIHSVHPPAYGNGRVYVTTGGHQDSYLYAFDAASGTVAFRSAYGNQWSRWYAPVVSGGTVYMAGGYFGGMYSFTADDGEQNWFAGTAQYDEWTPAVDGGRVYAYTASGLQVSSAATGTTEFTIADPGFGWSGYTMHVAPVLGSSNNVLTTQGGRLISFDLGNRSIGWQRTGSYRNNPVLADGTIYVMNNNQVEARRESDGSLLWVWIAPQGTPQRTMVATSNLLFVSTDVRTYAIDLTARLAVWSYPAGGHLTLTRDGILLIAQADGELAAIDLK
jgi:uncharacterized protein YjdB